MLRLLLIAAPLWIQPLEIQASRIEQQPSIPSSQQFDYEFYDLGPTDLPMESLSRNQHTISMSPKINDCRQIVYNLRDQSMVLELDGRTFSPQMSSIPAHCHGIDNASNLLLSFGRSSTDTVFSLWEINHLKVTKKQSLEDFYGNPGNHLFRASANGKIAVGSFMTSGPLRPLIWTKEHGLHHLGYHLGFDLLGVALDVNSQQAVIGKEFSYGEMIPFIWHQQKGLYRLQSFKSRLESIEECRIIGKVTIADIILGQDNMLYGTYTIDDGTKDIHTFRAFSWDPIANEVRKLDLKGMRLNAVSPSRTFVGQQQGLAALSDWGGSPIHLTELKVSVPTEWELIDATSINSYGDIVGYGKKNGHTQIFALKHKCATACTPYIPECP